MITEDKKIRYKSMEVGDRVVLIESVENGLIKLKPFDEGSIIYLQNQIHATVWLRGFGRYSSDPIVKALEIDNSFHKNGKLDGIAVELRRSSFAIKYTYCNEQFKHIVVDEDKALTIPFFEKDESHRLKSRMSRNNGNGEFEPVYQYGLHRIIDVVSDGFEEWVSKNTKSRRIKKSEKENGDFPYEWDTCLTDESINIFHEKKREIELAFSKATGVYYEFSGGLLFE